MPRETELKYAVSAGSWDELLAAERLGPFPLEAGECIEVRDAYADTSDGAIAEAGFAFRIRQSEGRRLACLKSLGRGEGIAHSREEFECAIGPSSAPEHWPEGETRDRFFMITAGRPVETRVEIRQMRFKRYLTASGVKAAEVSLDEVSVTSGGGRHTFLELEIEMLSEDLLDNLDALHDELMAAYELQPVETSKFERAMLLAQPVIPKERSD